MVFLGETYSDSLELGLFYAELAFEFGDCLVVGFGLVGAGFDCFDEGVGGVVGRVG